jgi:DNA anti-recombination protein RmuC
MAKWLTVQEAEKVLSLSERSIRRRIDSGKLESKKQGGRRIVRVDVESEESATASDTRQVSDSDIESELVQQLRAENEYLRQELSQARERSDTIILQLTRQVEQSQRLLEYKREPWYRRWFRHGKMEV